MSAQSFRISIMNKAVVAFGCLMALLVLVEARPPKGKGFDDICAGNSTCEEGARICKDRMKDSFMKKGKRDRKMHFANMKECAEQLDIELPERPEDGSGEHRHGGDGGRRGGEGGKHGHEHKGLYGSMDEDQMMELKKCIMEKAGVIDGSGLLNREPILTNIQEAFADDSNLLSTMASAVNTCPEPEDVKVWEFFKCLSEVCINNITL
ncbi:unnamed protein product [Meganyctiphanes norvegica]|uniref:Uncharacterized protein n=1 Tax=Meganyctiphanes norvegica TaxID=48144 RepID=A0AAV2QQ76_MEGNR